MYQPDNLLETFLDGKPRAETWRHLRETLQDRLKHHKAELSQLPEGAPGRVALRKKIEDLRQQVIALAEEEAISQFVEDSVRATVARPHPLEPFDEEE